MHSIKVFFIYSYLTIILDKDSIHLVLVNGVLLILQDFKECGMIWVILCDEVLSKLGDTLQIENVRFYKINENIH